MDKQVALAVLKDAEAALAPVAAKYGLSVGQVRGSYDPETGIKVRVEFKTSDAGRVTFQKYATMFGLKPEDFGAKFTARGVTYEVTGLLPNSRRFPLLASPVGGGRAMKFGLAGVAKQLDAARATRAPQQQ